MYKLLRKLPKWDDSDKDWKELGAVLTVASGLLYMRQSISERLKEYNRPEFAADQSASVIETFEQFSDLQAKVNSSYELQEHQHLVKWPRIVPSGYTSETDEIEFSWIFEIRQYKDTFFDVMKFKLERIMVFDEFIDIV